MLIAALSDVHGIRSRFEKARRLVEEGIKALLLGGDIAQNGPPDFQQANVRACLEILLSGKKNVRIFAIPGNDDWKIVEETLREFPEVTVPMGGAYPLGSSFFIIGYPYVPITPFLFKDYEKWDDDRYPEMPADPAELEGAMIAHRLNLEGYRTQGLERYEFRFDSGDRKDNISADMRKLAGFSDPQRTVYLFHCPPFGFFDFGMGIGSRIGTEGRVHIGSRSIAEFIRNNNPWLTIHGHSHEAVSVMKGEFTFCVGRSIGVAVGAGNDAAILNGILIDVARRSLRRITL
ncbi:MAG: metallophosphoesterase [Acidobacteriota bacterium]